MKHLLMPIQASVDSQGLVGRHPGMVHNVYACHLTFGHPTLFASVQRTVARHGLHGRRADGIHPRLTLVTGAVVPSIIFTLVQVGCACHTSAGQRNRGDGPCCRCTPMKNWPSPHHFARSIVAMSVMDFFGRAREVQRMFDQSEYTWPPTILRRSARSLILQEDSSLRRESVQIDGNSLPCAGRFSHLSFAEN